MDGLGQRLLHVLRHEHRVHLALPEGGAPSAAGSTRATARRSGARAAGPRSPSTSWSARSYEELDHPSLYVRFPLKGREGESLVVWTTTPWTLPANVAAAVKPDAEYVRLARRRLASAETRIPTRRRPRRRAGRSWSGSSTTGRSTTCRRSEGVVHRVIPWDDVTLDEGTGIVHIAPGCGAEDFELSRVHDLPVLVPIDEAGRILRRLRPVRRAARPTRSRSRSSRRSRERGLLVEAGRIVHRYPICWRCRTPLVFRVVDDWFIAVRRDPRSRCSTRTRRSSGRRALLEAHGRLAPQHGRLEHLAQALLRPAAAVLPVRVRAPERGRLAGRARGAGDRRPRPAPGAAPAVDRRGADPLRACGREVRRIPEVGDAWLDAGIVPFSTLGWENPEWIEGGYATGAAAGLSGADLPDHAYWEQWFPADWVSEMREQIRLWFYSQLFMSVTLRRPLAVPARAHLREAARRDRPGDAQLVGQRDRGERGVRADGRRRDALAVLRAAAEPEPELRLRAGERGQAPAAHVLELGLVLRHLREHRGLPARVRRPRGGAAGAAQPLDAGSSRGRSSSSPRRPPRYERVLDAGASPRVRAFVDDLSNWYIRRSRRRFYGDDEAAFRTLWYALVQALRVIAPVMPFLAEELWRNLVAGRARARPTRSSSPAGRRRRGAGRRRCSPRSPRSRRVVELGRQARVGGGHQAPPAAPRGSSSRAPSATGEHVDEIARRAAGQGGRAGRGRGAGAASLKPNLPVLGPRLGKELPAVRAALAAGRLRGARRAASVRVDGRRARAGRGARRARAASEGWAVASEDGSPSRSTRRSTPTLELERRASSTSSTRLNAHAQGGRARDHRPDRRHAARPTQADLLEQHGDWIKEETLAVTIEANGGSLSRRSRRPDSTPGTNCPTPSLSPASASARRISTGSRKKTSSSTGSNGRSPRRRARGTSRTRARRAAPAPTRRR